MKKTKQFIKHGFILFLSFYLIGCSASSHMGIVTIKQPDKIACRDVNTWAAYYKDQFDAYKGNVIAPDDSYAPEAQQGYQLGALDWQNKVSKASTNSYIAAGAATCGLLGILAILDALISGDGN